METGGMQNTCRQMRRDIFQTTMSPPLMPLNSMSKLAVLHSEHAQKIFVILTMISK